MEKFNFGAPEIFKLEVDTTTKNNFLEMARWTKFLAILGLVSMGLAFVSCIVAAVILVRFSHLSESVSGSSNGISALAPSLLMIPFAGIYFYPIYALLKYSNCIKRAVNSDNKDEFSRAIKYLKNMFKYMGILTIVLMLLFALAFIANLSDLSKLPNQ